MAAGTVTVYGPYEVNDSATIASDLTTGGGAIVKGITSWQDQENRFVWFLVNTEA
jgi:hypothetical protein